jgi:UDP-N-acetylmuramoyl-tripeptide--D-alanyl-D-alanine ligase
VNFEHRTENGVPKGISFKLETGGSFVPVKIDGVFGRGHAYAAAAAACVGLTKGINLVKISEAFEAYQGEPGRLRLIPGRNDSFLIDDTYNAAPLSVIVALDVLGDLDVSRKVAVLGDMAELGQYSAYAHETIGKKAAKIVSVLVAVGEKGKAIAEGARKAGLPKDKIFTYKTSKDAKEGVAALLEKDDVCLVKGSQSMRMERIVKECMAEPGNAKRLLVRQYGKWLHGE